MSDFLSLNDILTAPDIKEYDVDVPEWGGKVKVRNLSKDTQVKIRKQAVKNGVTDDRLLEGLILVEGLVSPKVEPHHLDQLFEKSSAAVDALLLKILNLSGMDKESIVAADADLKS